MFGKTIYMETSTRQNKENVKGWQNTRTETRKLFTMVFAPQAKNPKLPAIKLCCKETVGLNCSFSIYKYPAYLWQRKLIAEKPTNTRWYRNSKTIITLLEKMMYSTVPVNVTE